jgi:hypothetical protein
MKPPSCKFYLFLLAILMNAYACAGIQTLDDPTLVPIELKTLEENPDKHGMKGGWELPDKGLIVKIPKNSKVPLRIQFEASFMTLVPNKNYFQFDRDVFLYLSKKKFMISPDNEKWAFVHDAEALKKLFGDKHGELKIGFGVNSETGAMFNIGMVTK